MKLKIIGPFISNYSLAKVNRGLAWGLKNQGLDAKLFQFEEKFDKVPTKEDFKTLGLNESIWLKENEKTDVAIFNDFPKGGMNSNLGLSELNANLIIPYIAWEESIYPKKWVDEINEHAHMVFVISSFIRNVLIESGVRVPIFNINLGLDPNSLKDPTGKYKLKTKKSYKFLHISTGRVRKGVDVLIEAFNNEFSKDDDVALVIKTFPGPDNKVNEIINKVQSTSPSSKKVQYTNTPIHQLPEIEHISNLDLTDQEIVNLINTCDCGVYPSRAEGLGLPVAESMYFNKPTIATGYSGFLDFVSDDTSFPIDFELTEAINSENFNPGAKWAEPSVAHLSKLMRKLFEDSDSNEVQEKIKNAKKFVKKFDWDNVAKNIESILNLNKDIASYKNKNYAVISTLNSEDGIAEYTYNLFSKVESSFKNFYYISNKDISDKVRKDKENVVRLWETNGNGSSEVILFIKQNEIDAVNIQYHSDAHWSLKGLDELLTGLNTLGINVSLTLHSRQSKDNNIITNLQTYKPTNLQTIFVHNQEDVGFLSSQELENVLLLKHPKYTFKNRVESRLKQNLSMEGKSPIIATHGFLNSQKTKLEEVILAISNLKKDYPNIHYLAVNAVSNNNFDSSSALKNAQDLVKDLGLSPNVTFITDFLGINQIEILLQLADICILPYVDVGEAASGAIDKCLASNSPTIVPDIPMFKEFNNEVFKIEETKASKITQAVKEISEGQSLSRSLKSNAQKYIEEYSYEKQVLRLLNSSL